MLSTYPLPAAPQGLEVRQIGPADREALTDLFERMSPRSRQRRFLVPKEQLTEGELTYFTDIDHVSHEALAAVDSEDRIIGIVRYAAWNGRPHIAEVSAVVADDWQGHGVGTSLMRMLIMRARSNGLARLTATTTWENHPARSLLATAGFRGAGSNGDVLEMARELRS